MQQFQDGYSFTYIVANWRDVMQKLAHALAESNDEDKLRLFACQ